MIHFMNLLRQKISCKRLFQVPGIICPVTETKTRMLQARRTSITSLIWMMILLLPKWVGILELENDLVVGDGTLSMLWFIFAHSSHVDMHNQPGDVQNCDTVSVVQYVCWSYCQCYHDPRSITHQNIFFTPEHSSYLMQLLSQYHKTCLFPLRCCIFSLFVLCFCFCLKKKNNPVPLLVKQWPDIALWWA